MWSRPKSCYPPAPTQPSSSHVDGAVTWPDKPSFLFMNGIRDDDERTTYGLWAEGNSPQGYEHLLPKPIVEKDPVLQSEAELPPATPLVPASQSETEAQPAAPLVPFVPIKTTVPTSLPAVPLQKEMLVSTTTNDAPKAPDVTKCDDPLKVVHKY